MPLRQDVNWQMRDSLFAVRRHCCLCQKLNCVKVSSSHLQGMSHHMESVTPSREDRISESECHETPEITAEQLADTSSDMKLSIG
jgi:hypothetical protein